MLLKERQWQTDQHIYKLENDRVAARPGGEGARRLAAHADILAHQHFAFCNATGSAFAQNKVLAEANRQVESAAAHKLQVEWLVSDKEAVTQLTALFKNKGINIKVTHLLE